MKVTAVAVVVLFGIGAGPGNRYRPGVIPFPPPDPETTAPPRPVPLTLAEATRVVVKAIADRGAELRRLPEPAAGDKPDAAGKRPRGDRLTAEYVRAAAAAAVTLDPKQKAPAFLLGLGIALDDSTMVRNNPTVSAFWKTVETDAERKTRAAAVGAPTVRDRRDLCQHFFVSVALTQHLGAAAAESAGISKELLDAFRPSGFSFVDLAADFGGVAFAVRVTKDPKLVDEFARGFDVADHAPAIDGLVEGLPAAKFLKKYGGADDPRFKKAVADIRARVADVPGGKKSESRSP